MRGLAVWIASNDPEWAGPAREVLARLPKMAAVIEEELDQQRWEMLDHGWTEEALDDVERHLVLVPPEASAAEAALRLLAVLMTLRPSVEAVAPGCDQSAPWR